MKLFLVLTALVLFLWQALPVENQFESPADVMCACPGEVLTFTCIVEGGNITIWSGSAFDCAGNESQIILVHEEFNNGTSGECNDGAIIGQSVDTIGTCYISQLNVTASNELNNKTVNCSSDSAMYIGESLINMAVYSAPDIIYLSDAQKGILVFSWAHIAFDADCSAEQYSITSDCGTCTITNITTATCSDLQLSFNAVTCHFQVSSAICDRSGDPSSAVPVTMKVPNIPQVEIVPYYSNSDQSLEMLYITVNQTEDLFYISGNISGIPTSYSAHISLTSGSSSNSTVEMSSCNEGCEYPLTQKLPISYCPQSTTINVSISAANKLGEGPYSNAFMIECTNTFVQVLYKETSSESTISCIFLNPSDTSEKTCCITYQPCDHEGTNISHGCNNNSPYRINLDIISNQKYCYTIKATNGTHTVKVVGDLLRDFKQLRIRTKIAIAVVVAVVVLLIIIAICLLTKYRFCNRRARLGYHQVPRGDVGDIQTLEQCPVPYQFPSTMKLHEVQSDCELKDYVTNTLNVKHGFRRGHTYYEFTNEVENILKGKQVLLQDKKKPKIWFRSRNMLATDYVGEGILLKNFGEQYKVFIQSFGSGTRHLLCNSSIIYNHSDKQVEPDVLPLVPVCSEHFAHKVIDSEEGFSAQQFCLQYRLNPKALNIFLAVEYPPKGMRDQPPQDVILMNRESRKLFTGPYARQILDTSDRGELQQDSDKWKVFALLDKNKQGLMLQKNSEVLYQDSRYMNGVYLVLEVDEDCVRMSKFIETKLECQYEDGKAFYEAGKEEDLLYCKKILRPQKEQLNREQLELQSLVEYFYAIAGVPAKGVKSEKLRLEHHKIFIQSTSQGSRCLKKGEKLLYLKEYITSNDYKLQVDPDEASHAHP